MDSYKLKKIIITTIIIMVNIVFIGMASVSIVQSIKEQLKEEKSGTNISKNEKQEGTDFDTNTDEEVPTDAQDNDLEQTSGELSLDFAQIIKYLKSEASGKILAGVEILIGLNLVIISILLLVKLKKFY